jgi:hypothetical protein
MANEKKRHRRTPEELIADLQAKIEEVKARANKRSIKETDAGRAAVKALRAIDAGLNAEDESSNQGLRYALADARKPLAAYLESQGVRLSKPRMPRGPRPS